MKPYLFIFMLSLWAYQLKAQEEIFKPALMPAKFGAKLIYTSDKHSFTLDIVSKNIKPDIGPGIIQVDGKILQFTVIHSKATDRPELTAKQQESYLSTYVQYELDYIKKEAKLDITNVGQSFLMINDKPYLLWYYDMPSKYETVSKQIQLSSIHFGEVLTLNSPVEKGGTIDAGKELLMKVANTIKENNFSIDLDKLYKELQDK